MKYRRRGAIPAEKPCGLCRQVLPLSAFHMAKSSKASKKHRRQSYCKPCGVKWGKEWRKRNIAWARIRSRRLGKRWRVKMRMMALRRYGGNPPKCRCCGESNIEFLGIDHIGGRGGVHRKQIGSHLAERLGRMGWPSGYRVLCHNCNLSRGYYGYCPHRNRTRRRKWDQ